MFSGLLTANSAGTVAIHHFASNGCGSSIGPVVYVTVEAGPNAGVISGMTTVCNGTPATLSASGMTGGTWNSSNMSVLNIDFTGVATYVSPGSATVSYSVTNSCGTATATIDMSTLNVPNAGT